MPSSRFALSLAASLTFLFLLSGQMAVADYVIIKNINCEAWFQPNVSVRIYAPDEKCDDPEDSLSACEGKAFVCTQAWINVDKGKENTVPLEPIGANGTQVCVYLHEAEGTSGGKVDVKGNENSRVNCEKDWAGVCQCTKDPTLLP